MIASIRGIITYKTSELRKDSYVVVEAAGVGYKIFTPASNLKKLHEGEEVIMFTYLSVSEYAMDLYGFVDPSDKTFFTLLLDVPGIGAKSALGILDKTTMGMVQQAILENDPSLLTKMSGLTEKTADKIIVALKSKVESLSGGRGKSEDAATKVTSLDADAFDALISFGYSNVEARNALNKVDKSITDSSQRLREALKLLHK